MKRETRAWLRQVRRDDMDRSDHPATDILATDAENKALRAEVKRKDAALRLVREDSIQPLVQAYADAALAPKQRKP